MQRLALILGLTFVLAACGESAKTSDTAKEQVQAPKPAEAAAEAPTTETVKEEVTAAVEEVKAEAKEAVSDAGEKVEAVAEKAKETLKEQVKAPVMPANMFEEGKHYEVLAQPVRTITPGKIEVTEVFAYTCGHCFNFEPIVNAWKKTLPDYVELVKSPAVWNASMEPLARMHFTAIALHVQDTISAAAFHAIHRERKQLKTQADIAELFVAAGVEEAKFNEVFNSFTISSQVNQANARARSMKITATPEVVVDGRFRISTRFDGVSSQADMLKVANFLTNQIHNNKL